jgi:hypothetical protein
MPSVKALADAEAARAEAEETEAEEAEETEPTEPEPEPEPEPEAEPEAGAKERSPEAIQAEFERIVGDFHATLVGFLGATEELVPVALPGAVGFYMPGAIERRTTDDFKRCPVCNGHGTVDTTSLRAGWLEEDCPRCAGRGYLKRQAAQPAPPVTPAVTGPTVYPAPVASEPSEEWGTPAWMGDPNVHAAGGFG